MFIIFLSDFWSFLSLSVWGGFFRGACPLFLAAFILPHFFSFVKKIKGLPPIFREKSNGGFRALSYALSYAFSYALFAEPSTFTILCLTISFIIARASPRY